MHHRERNRLVPPDPNAAADGEILPVRAPLGGRNSHISLLCQFLEAAAVRLHDPDIVAPVAIGDERDLLTSGREYWLRIPCHPAGQPPRFPALHGDGIEIPQKIE